VSTPESGGQPNPEPWDEHEQDGNVYEVEIDEQTGQVSKAEKLTPTPSIWVGSWLDYNNGVLHGQWIDAARDEAAVHADIQAMLAASPTTAQTGEPAEDWGIFDSDNFGPLRIDEQESVSWVSAVARGIREHGLAFAAYADVVEDEAALSGFIDSYLGHYESVEEYARQLADELGYEQLLDEALPESLRHYVQIDYTLLTNEMTFSGELHLLPAEGGGVWLFRSQ
jgi:antirestriction protein